MRIKNIKKKMQSNNQIFKIHIKYKNKIYRRSLKDFFAIQFREKPCPYINILKRIIFDVEKFQ